MQYYAKYWPDDDTCVSKHVVIFFTNNFPEGIYITTIIICNTIKHNGRSIMNMYERKGIVWCEKRTYPERIWTQNRNQSRENVEMIISDE